MPLMSSFPDQQDKPRRYRDFRILKVIRTRQLTPAMRRITLGGDEIAGFGEGPNVKLLVPPAGISEPKWPMAGPDGKAIWPPLAERPSLRTYSLRRHDAGRGEIDIDFVLHGEHGPASRWAASAAAGDLLGVGGPGGLTIRDADFYLLAGDHTAVPAISRIVERLPPHARGHAFLEVPGPEDEQRFETRADIGITWLHRNGSEAGRNDLLHDAVRAMPWPVGMRVFAWIGCESATVRRLRAYVRGERGLDARQHLAIGYWRYGMNETSYHDAHNNDRDEDYFRMLREQQERH